MKTSLIVALATTVLGGLGFSEIVSRGSVAAQTPDNAAQKQQESPFYCNRLGLNPEQRKRHFEELGPKLRSLAKSVRELPDGYEFEFPADPSTFQVVAEWTIQERSCCPFFDLEMRLEREGGPLWLRLTGREGVKQFIKADFQKWIRE